MLETATDPTLRAIAREAHRRRSLAAWQMIDPIRALPARLRSRLRAWHTKRAAPKNGPAGTMACAA